VSRVEPAATPLADIVAEAERLLAAARASNVPIRLIGGRAVYFRHGGDPCAAQPLVRRHRCWERLEREPKSRKWRLRDRVGDRKRWYELPDEV
jgi:hypothetical protein